VALSTLSVQDRIGPFRLVSLVGTGRHCEVWEAVDDDRRLRVALKVLLPDFAKNREQVGLLRHEHAVGRGLDHPNVIHVYGVDTHRSMVYIVMELFAAQNAKQLLLQEGVEGIAYLVQPIAEQATAALGYLHLQGWIHRDVKPDNFLVNRKAELKLIDFALAERRKGLLGKFLPGRSKIQGTRSYMSPEQIRGQGVDERSDIYSLGCVLHELVSGKPPFTGQTTQDLLTKHLRQSPPPLEASGRDVTPAFAELVRHMLAKNPSKRPRNMEDIHRELRGLQVFSRIPAPPAAR
jgi:serine/threonine protein kinase